MSVFYERGNPVEIKKSDERGVALRWFVASAARAESYRGTSLIRNTPPVASYSSPMPRDLR